MTAFLGYIHSPKWSKLNKNSYLLSFTGQKLIKMQNASFLKGLHNNINFKISLGLRYNSTSRHAFPQSTALLLRRAKWLEERSGGVLCKGEECTTNLRDHSNNFKSIKEFTFNNSGDLKKIVHSKVLTNFLTEKRLSPVYCYEDLNLNSTRKKIQMETKNLSGIYLILNKITLDYYIGSAATNRFYARFSNHLLYFRGSKVVKLAVRKYKLDQFAFLILEIFPEVVNRINNKRLLDLEDFYLKSLLPNYNILTEAGSSFGYKHTEITRLKMKAEYSPERREKIGSLNRGLSLSSSTKEKIRNRALTRDKRIYSDEAILNMKKKSKPIILYNLDNTVYGEFTSIVEASKSIGCSEKTIRRAFKTDKKILKRRWIVKYL